METPTTEFRTCTKCGATKTLDCISQRKTRKGDLVYRGECKTCRTEQTTQWRRDNPEKQKEAKRRANVKRRETGLKKIDKRRYRLIKKGYSPEKAKELSKTTSHSRANEKRYDHLAVKNAKQAWDFWIKKKAPDTWVESYYEASSSPWNNPRLSEAEQYRVQYRLDPEFNLNERIRTKMKKMAKLDKVGDLIRGALARGGRSPRAEKLLGYSIAELRMRLESQFTKGMTWEKFNAGEIHIDHIVPISSFDFASEGDAGWRSCWCYTNLRPLWAADNLAKSNKRTHLL